MNHFQYHNGRLMAEGVALADIAAAVGTPVYVYSTATLVRHYEIFAGSFRDQGLDARIFFAMKANSNLAVVRTLARAGAGADVVSGGELAIALEAGVPGRKIVFSGVGKTCDELKAALVAGVYQINVESVPELHALSAVASELGVEAPIALRVNPDVGAGGHAKITTGKKENKFGIDIADAPAIYQLAKSLPGIAIKAVAVHIGSQITDLAPFHEAFVRVRELVGLLQGQGIQLERVDLGGGLGIPYEDGNEVPPPPPEYAAMIKKALGDLNCKIMLEPGRLIVGNAGVLVSQVVYVKQGGSRQFLILDAAMNDLVRPVMYEAYHAIVPLIESPAGAPHVKYDVVGPICETGDTFAKHRALPVMQAGDLVAFRTAGAYGAAMASQYNARPLVPEVLVDGDRYAVIRRRPTLAEMLSLETIPEWLAD